MQKKPRKKGIALLFYATAQFLQSEFDKEGKKGFGFGLLFQYLLRYKSDLI